jgi:protein-S-isoprenylcysteine O-methyltransferase Ste14
LRGKDNFSNLILNFGGGIFYFCGSLVSLLDFVIFQNVTYHSDFLVLGFALLIVGLGVRIQATRTLGKFFSTKVRVLPEHKLIKHGIYKHVRHPIYLGSMLAFFSVTLIFRSLYGFIITTIAIPFILHKIQVEEQMLIEKFGDEYREYVRNSKRLIPYIY